MKKYCVNGNVQFNGDHEVYREDRQYLPHRKTVFI